MTLVVSEISASSHDLSDKEFQALKEDIRHHGQLLPIWKAGDEIIDGRKRFRACQELGIKPKVIDMDIDQDRTAVGYSLNVLRTHYTCSQRAMYAAKMATLKRGQREQSVVNSMESSGSDNRSIDRFGKTAAQAGKEAGVGAVLVYRAKAIRREASPEVTRAVEEGKLSLHAAKQITLHIPKDKQAATIADVLASRTSTDGRLHTQKALGKDKPHKPPQKSLEIRMMNIIQSVANGSTAAVSALSEEGAATHILRSAWLRDLRKARTDLSRAINSGSRTRNRR